MSFPRFHIDLRFSMVFTGWICAALLGCDSTNSPPTSHHTLIRKHYPKTLQVKEEYFVLDSTMRDSLYLSWHRNGTRKDSGYFKMGKREGLWYEMDSLANYKEPTWLYTKIYHYRNDTLFKEDEIGIWTNKEKYGAKGYVGRHIKYYHSDTLQLDSVWNEDGSLNMNKMKFNDDRMDSIITYESPGKYFYKDVLYHGQLLITIHYYPKSWVEVHNDPSPEMRKRLGLPVK